MDVNRIGEPGDRASEGLCMGHVLQRGMKVM